MEKKRVKILYRVSTKKQLYGDDIPMQEKANRECVKQHPDWVVIDEIYERGVSAYKNHVEDRDAIMMLMEQAERHEYDVLLVYMSDRISRISEEYFIYRCGCLNWALPFGVQWKATGQFTITSRN